MKVKELTKKDYLSKIDDFEADARVWKLLGDSPDIVAFYASWC